MGKRGPTRQYTTELVYDTIESGDDQCEPWTAGEIAEALGCSNDLAVIRLDELVEDGELKTKKVGGRSRVWWNPA